MGLRSMVNTEAGYILVSQRLKRMPRLIRKLDRMEGSKLVCSPWARMLRHHDGLANRHPRPYKRTTLPDAPGRAPGRPGAARRGPVGPERHLGSVT